MCARLLVALLVPVALLALAPAASAQTSVYHIRGNATAGSNNIWAINPTTGAQTLVYTGYPGGNAATLAQRPSDGMLFYVINSTTGSNGAVYRFNPATPAVAPVLLGNIGPSTSGGNVLSGFRMAFSPSGTLYYMSGGGGADNDTLYTVNQTTGRATPVATITGTASGGDMAFSSAGTLYIINQNRQLYSASVAGGAATLVGTVTFPGGATPGTLGLGVDGTRVLIQTQNPSNLYAITLPSLSATLFSALGGGTTSTGDLSTAAVTAPDISVTKTDGVTNTYQGATLTYTVVVRNNGTYTVDANLADNVPAALTGVTWTCAASSGSSCEAASGSGNSISTGARLAASGTATYTVTGTVNASSGSVANTATVSLDATWIAESNTTNNSATDTDTVVAAADLSITKAAATTLRVGADADYTLTVRNNGPQSAAGTITVSDTLPGGLTYVSASGTGWACSNSGATVSCTRPGPVTSGTTLPAITLRVTVGTAAAPSVTNSAGVDSSATFDPDSSDDTSSVTTGVYYLRLDKSYTLGGPNPVPGTDINYTVAFSNLGGATLQGVSLVDPDPATTLRISDSTDFKLGSASTVLGGFTGVVVAYSNDGGATYVYSPLSGAGGAPAGYDRTVTHIRWSFTGTLSAAASGSVSFTARIR